MSVGDMKSGVGHAQRFGHEMLHRLGQGCPFDRCHDGSKDVHRHGIPPVGARFVGQRHLTDAATVLVEARAWQIEAVRRSEERSVGKEWVSTGRSWWVPE